MGTCADANWDDNDAGMRTRVDASWDSNEDSANVDVGVCGRVSGNADATVVRGCCVVGSADSRCSVFGGDDDVMLSRGSSSSFINFRSWGTPTRALASDCTESPLPDVSVQLESHWLLPKSIANTGAIAITARQPKNIWERLHLCRRVRLVILFATNFYRWSPSS